MTTALKLHTFQKQTNKVDKKKQSERIIFFILPIKCMSQQKHYFYANTEFQEKGHHSANMQAFLYAV